MIILNNVDIKSDGRDAVKEIEAILKERKSEYEDALIPDLSHINHRAENHTGIEIEDVSYISESMYQLDYKYDWNVYNGCADMDGWGVEEASVIIEIPDDRASMEIEIPEKGERTTLNEF